MNTALASNSGPVGISASSMARLQSLRARALGVLRSFIDGLHGDRDAKSATWRNMFKRTCLKCTLAVTNNNIVPVERALEIVIEINSWVV